MGSLQSKTEETRYECYECKNVISIQRLRGRKHKAGHVKHMHCPKCMKTTGHVQLEDK